MDYILVLIKVMVVVHLIITRQAHSCSLAFRLLSKLKIYFLKMRHNNYLNKSIKSSVFIALLLLAGCTKMDEQLYDRVTSANFLQTKDDVTRDFLRAFEHSYWTIQGNNLFALQEDASDEIMTPNRQGDWFDGGQY